jgi:uncharacterized membrane protein
VTEAFLNWLRASWDAARTSLWLIPGLMLSLGIVLALAVLRIDEESLPTQSAMYGWISTGDGQDARNLLSTLLAAVIAMASIVFSVTIVSLSLAANTYGPRLVRTFRSNPRTQIVLGIFVMTIVYLLLVLRSVRGAAAPPEVPQLAVAAGSVLALVCVLALLAFIQGVASLIVADEVVRRVRRQLDTTISRLPALAPAEAASAELPPDFDQRAGRIRLPREGYVQAVEYRALARWAEKHDAIVRLDVRPGDFVVDGDHKVLVYPAPASPDRARDEIDKFIVSGDQRSPTQDLEFAIRDLVEVAVRALSPGINDPFTAIAALDRLRGGLARLAGRNLPKRRIFGENGRLRLVRKVTTYAGAADVAFNQIRQASASKPAVLIHMLAAIGAIAEHLRTGEQRDALVRHAELIKSAAQRSVDDPHDLEDVNSAFEDAARALREWRASGTEDKPA